MDIEKLSVSGNRERLFINTGIGCEGGCQYCYLSNIGIKEVMRNIDKKTIMKEVEKRERDGEFIEGDQGTIVSFGCFTECWNKNTRELTREMILFFLNKGNYVQMATKEFIDKKDIEMLSGFLKFKNQLTINVSLPVYHEARQIEPYAEDVDKRILNFRYNKQYGIDLVLYIKPVLEEITIKNLDIYVKLVQNFNLRVIVGKYLHVDKVDNATLQIVGNQEMWQKESEQQREVIKVLHRITKVYENSTQIIEEYRRKN